MSDARFIPQTEGFYWMKMKGNDPKIVEVDFVEGYDAPRVWLPGSEVPLRLVALTADLSVSWSGPIAPPPDWVVPR